jgi:sec-independent protein translocase protein TatC
MADEPMTFLEHAAELRRRLISSVIAVLGGSIVCFIFYDPIIEFLQSPLESVMKTENGAFLFVGTVFEAFIVKFKLSIYSGVVSTTPIHLFNIAAFVFPGLRLREKRIVAWSLAASAVLAATGFYFGYYHIIPAMIELLTSSSFLPGRVEFLLGFEKNIIFVVGFLFAVLIVFQLPLLLLILLALNILSRRAVLRSSRFVVVGIFVLAAIVTPSPDMISQLMLALPLIALFFLAILAAKILHLGDGACSE